MNRVIVEYKGRPDEMRDAAIDAVADRLDLERGDTGYSFSDGVRDHSVPAGDDRGTAYAHVAEFRRSLPWATVRIWPEDDA